MNSFPSVAPPTPPGTYYVSSNTNATVPITLEPELLILLLIDTSTFCQDVTIQSANKSTTDVLSNVLLPVPAMFSATTIAFEVILD